MLPAWLAVACSLALVAQNAQAATANRRRAVTPPSVTPAYKAASWKFLGGPPGDLGYDIRYNFSNHHTWYVTDANAGFFISTDDGKTWAASNDGIDTAEGTVNIPIFCATVDPHDANTIWVGTQFDGHIYKSTNGGRSFEKMDNGVSPHAGHSLRGFTVDPRSSDIVYANAEVEANVLGDTGRPDSGGAATQGGRIFKTTDGGRNWSKIWEGNSLVRYVWIDPANSNLLYASTGIFDRMPLRDFGLGVLKSTDGGATWTNSTISGLKMQLISSLYMKPGDSKTLLAGTGCRVCPMGLTDQERSQGFIALTTDGGATWKPVTTEPDVIGAVEYCEQNSNIAYAAGARAAYRSDDGGLTWQTYQDASGVSWAPDGLLAGVPIDIQIDPDSNCQRLFINNYIGGNFESTDGARTWRSATVGYSGALALGVEVDPANPSRVFAAVRLAPYASEDGGTTWTHLSHGGLTGGGQNIWADPGDPKHLFVVEGEKATFAPRLMETKDGGKTWNQSQKLDVPAGVDELRWGRMKVFQMAFAPTNRKIIYTATANPPGVLDEPLQAGDSKGCGIYRSSDGGTTWTDANDGSTRSLGFTSIAVDPTDSQTVYAGALDTEGIYKTTDGGKSWSPVNSGIPATSRLVRAIAIDPSDRRTIYAGTLAGLFKSTDGGGSWTQLTAGLDAMASVSSMVIDPVHPGVVYVGTPRHGAWVSTNGGAQFQKLSQGLDAKRGELVISDLAISSDGSVLYAGTLGRAVMRLGTPSR